MKLQRRARSARTIEIVPASEVLLWLTLASAHLALIVTREITLVHTALLALSLPVMAGNSPRLRALPAWLWNTFIVIVLLAGGAVALAPPRDFESFFHGLAYLLAGVIFVRYFTRRTARDRFWLFLLALLEICAASIATISISFLVSLILFSFVMVTSLLLFTIRDEMEAEARDGEDLRQRPPVRIERRFFAFAAGCAAAVLVAGFVIFFFIPRVGRSLFLWSRGVHGRVTGFSETVEMGSLGRTKIGRALVMRVKVDDPERWSGGLYLRGAALDNYNGRRWKNTLSVGRKGYHYLNRDGHAVIGKIGRLSDSVKQEITLEPTDSPIIFAVPYLKAINAPFRYRAVIMTENDYLRFPLDFPLYDRVSYTAWSVPPPGPEGRCAAAEPDPAPSEVNYRYLQLPGGLERLRDLARREAGSDPDPCVQARRLRDYLSKNFTYDLATPSDRAGDPLGDFLFNSRRGYCEHFATALVLLLRCQGVPARIAVGYLGSDYNPIEGFFRVRESDAHTWAEMRRPDGEWITLDPTPAQAREDRGLPGLEWLTDVLDSVRYRWDLYVVDLSLQQQFQLADSIRDRGVVAGRGLAELPGQFKNGLAGLIGGPALVVIVAAGALLYYFLARLPRRRGGVDSGAVLDPRLSKDYRLLLRALARRGLVRRPSETPLELASRLERASGPGSGAVREATEIYLAVRFGRVRREAEARAKIRRAIRSLTKV